MTSRIAQLAIIDALIACLSLADYEMVREARDRAGRTVLVGENDHYKPLAVLLRRLLARGHFCWAATSVP